MAEYVFDSKGKLIEVNDKPSEPTKDEKLEWIGQTDKSKDKK